MNLCWLILYTSGQKTQSSGSRDRAFVFFYLRVQVGSSPVLFKCQIKRFSSRCKTGAAHSLYQEQNVLPLPITSYPPGCLAYGLCIIYLLAYPLAACSCLIQVRGESQGRPYVVMCRYPPCFTHNCNTLWHFEDCCNIISQVQGQMSFCSVKVLPFLRIH